MKKIKKIGIIEYPDYKLSGHYDEHHRFVVDKVPLDIILIRKLNEIIEVINKLKEEG